MRYINFFKKSRMSSLFRTDKKKAGIVVPAFFNTKSMALNGG